MTRKENEATINCPSRGDDDDVVVSRSSFPLFVVFFFHTVVVSEITSLLRCCCSSLFFFFSSSSRARAQKRERYAHKSMHVNLERKRRDVPRVFGRRSMISFFFFCLCFGAQGILFGILEGLIWWCCALPGRITN